MQRVLRLSGLTGLLVTGLLSSHAFAQEPTNADAQPPAGEPATDQPAPVAPAAEVVAPAVTPAAKPKFGDISTHGYFRGGFGASNQKGRQTCFGLYSINGGLKSKYRLGNECEIWAELELRSVVYAGDDGSVASLHFMPVAFIPQTYIGYSPNSTINSPADRTTSTGATLSFPNLYVDIKGIPWLFGGTAWTGSRYYKRESVYISDFFYWNPSGVGAGIEDVNPGLIFDKFGVRSDFLRELRLSLGVFAVDGIPKSSDEVGGPQLPSMLDLGFRIDVQLRGIRPYRGGEFQIGFQYIENWTHKTDTGGNSNTNGGWGITVQHVQDLLGGNNKLAVQYGMGAGTGFGTLSRFYYPDFSIYWGKTEARLRIVDVLTIQPTEWFGTQTTFSFQRDYIDSPSAGDWISAGTRLTARFRRTAHPYAS
jgi:maltoporin